MKSGDNPFLSCNFCMFSSLAQKITSINKLELAKLVQWQWQCSYISFWYDNFTQKHYGTWLVFSTICNLYFLSFETIILESNYNRIGWIKHLYFLSLETIILESNYNRIGWIKHNKILFYSQQVHYFLLILQSFQQKSKGKFLSNLFNM